MISGGGAPFSRPYGKLADFRPEALDGDVSRRADRDRLPLPHPDSREGYFSNDHFRYWSSGLEDHDKALELAQEIGIDSGRESTTSADRRAESFAILCVRMIRSTCGHRISRLLSYQWNLAHMPLHVRPFLNTFYPSIPIPDHFLQDHRGGFPCSPISTNWSLRGCLNCDAFSASKGSALSYHPR